MINYILECRYDARASFYGKARVLVNGNKMVLLSYSTNVCEINGGVVTLHSSWDFSQTTLRHVKEFLKQNTSYCVDTKNDIYKLIDACKFKTDYNN